ncbi:ABC transporter substrate-binding protein [uncultured Faecalibaculum sp.]|uniref:ABC transporter substrate-binding protein n=1 Tax=uncultured Faecalibaculum sp. TaxID=1729681 RepID=UPI0025F4CE83|nr:ABC transporter substrate-binding protein [uncultured Faecalibaculum sp.]
MKRDFRKLLAGGLGAAVLLAGCSSASGSDNAGDGGSAETGDTVKIGLNFELTGEVSSYGTAERNGAQLAIDEFNAREDKPFTVEGVEIDSKGDPAESTTAAIKLIDEDQVAAIVGPATSAPSISTYQAATDKQTPVVSPSATQVDAMLNGDTPYEYAWRVCFEDSYQGAAMAIYAYDTLGDKKAAVINETSDYGQGLAKTFKEKFESLGGEVVAQEQYNAKDTDFASILTKIKGKDFDVLYIAGYYGEAGLIIKQARESGIDCNIVGADGFESEKLAELAGKENLNNVWYTTCYTTVNASDELKSFIDDYTAKYDQAPNMFSALAYDATNLVLDQLEATGKTGAELNEAIKKADFSGLTGSFVFDEKTHTPKKTVLVVNQKDGVQTEVDEVEVK